MSDIDLVRVPVTMGDLKDTIEASISEEITALIEENDRLRTLPAETLAHFLHWMVHRDVSVTIGKGKGADAISKPALAFVKANGLPDCRPDYPQMKTPGRVRA